MTTTRNAENIFRVPGYPVPPAIFLLFELTAFIQGLRECPVPTGAALATIAAGAIVYDMARSRAWLNAPQIIKP